MSRIHRGEQVLIIADSLTNDFVNPKERFLNNQVNVGLEEIERLMGKGAQYGRGPAPVFLNAAAKAVEQGRALSLLFARDVHDSTDPDQKPELLRFGDHNLAGGDGMEFAPPVEKAAAWAHVLETGGLALPVKGFHRALTQCLGRDPSAMSHEKRKNVKVLVCGVYTDVRVFNTAWVLRNGYGFPFVSVCPHLVASRHRAAHLSALSSQLPNALVEVNPDLGRVFSMCGLDPGSLELRAFSGCEILPRSLAAKLEEETIRILSSLFLFHETIQLTPLSGGYSGAHLFLAKGGKQGAKVDPKIVKIDAHSKMQKELEGYERVRDLLGKSVPAMGTPVSFGGLTGVKMELAAMEGEPVTFQTLYEKARTIGDTDRFCIAFSHALKILGTRLYANTMNRARIHPYRLLGLHSRRQRAWLEENMGHILGDKIGERLEICPDKAIDNPVAAFCRLVQSPNRITADLCLVHGDLNFANMIKDQKENTWIIDWAWCCRMPVDIDFAKMENDIKFVVSKEFEETDLPKLCDLEDLFVSTSRLPNPEKLPENLGFVLSDPRFFKMYQGVKLSRDVLFSLKKEREPLVFRVALLRFALHTLSFDAKRGKGECSPVQLRFALYSAGRLIEFLADDPFHAKSGLDRPASYPERFPIPAHFRPWEIRFPEYDPPEHTDQAVLSNAGPTGWADPNDPGEVFGKEPSGNKMEKLLLNSQGRP